MIPPEKSFCRKKAQVLKWFCGYNLLFSVGVLLKKNKGGKFIDTAKCETHPIKREVEVFDATQESFEIATSQPAPLLILSHPPHSGQVVFRKLNSSAAVIEEMTGVRIVRVVQKLCAGLDCPLQFCDEVISLDRTTMSTYSSARLSFVTPRHLRTATCQCEGNVTPAGARARSRVKDCDARLVSFCSPGDRCPELNNVCETSPCPEGMECVADIRDSVYSCVCPEAKAGKCSGKCSAGIKLSAVVRSQSTACHMFLIPIKTFRSVLRRHSCHTFHGSSIVPASCN